MTAASAGPLAEDPTRKQRRAAARAQRKALEEAAAANTLRRRRFAQLGVILAIVAAGFLAAIISTNGAGDSQQTPAGSLTARKTEMAVNASLAGIPQSGNALGAPSAPVTLQYFGDLECSACRQFALGALPSLIGTWVRTGKLRIEYRSLETATREPEEFRSQQVAALAAGRQNEMWQFVETFYREQGEEGSGYVTESYLQNIARQLTGLNLAQWSKARANTELAGRLSADAQAAGAVGLTGTPSFLLGRTGAAMSTFAYTSLSDPTSFNTAIRQLARG